MPFRMKRRSPEPALGSNSVDRSLNPDKSESLRKPFHGQNAVEAPWIADPPVLEQWSRMGKRRVHHVAEHGR